MTKKVEDLTNEQLNVLVATRVMEWDVRNDGSVHWVEELTGEECSVSHSGWWSPSTDIACAFQVDRPEWEWLFDESPHICMLRVGVLDHTIGVLKRVFVPLDPANKTAAYCRGRCIVALKACGVTEVEG